MKVKQAIILAAGMGKRLGPFSKENTKCMLKINGITLIERSLTILNANGIRKAVLVVGHKKEKLRTLLGNQYKDIQIVYIDNPIYYKTNNIYSLYLAREYLMTEHTLLLESDIIFEEKIIRKVLHHKRKVLTVVDKYQSWMDGTVVKLDENERITQVIPKKFFNYNEKEKYYKTVNIYKFSKEFAKNTYVPFLKAYSSSIGNKEYYEQVLRVITTLDEHEVYGLQLQGEKWYEIDNLQDKANAETLFSETPTHKLDNMSKRYGGYWRFPQMKDFCYLVNPYFPSQKMEHEMTTYFRDLISMYPSGLYVQNLLASSIFNVSVEHIVVGNGAAELIRTLSKNLKGTFGIPFPTFNEYPESIGYNRVVQFNMGKQNFNYTIKALLKFSSKVDHLLLINPDNPTGHYIHHNDIITLADELQKQNKTFIVDESFLDFSDEGENVSLFQEELLKTYKNLIVIKSISKSYGVPGIRLGVLGTYNKSILNKIKKMLPIWNINSFAEFFLQILGKYKSDYVEACEKIKNERMRFYKKLQSISYLKVFPSQANYFFCEVTEKFTATELTEKLLFENDIFIKDLTGKIGIDGQYIRIAVMDKEDNELLLRQLKKYN